VKTIRIWHGCKVLNVVTVSKDGTTSMLGATGGAANSTRVDLDIDPFAGLIVDHSTDNPPVYYRTEEQL
jgi:hypothetical protein